MQKAVNRIYKHSHKRNALYLFPSPWEYFMTLQDLDYRQKMYLFAPNTIRKIDFSQNEFTIHVMHITAL